MSTAVLPNPATPRRRSRVGMVNLVIGMILLLLIVPLAMHVNQNPPPVVAEFAPRAEQTIKDTPPDQTSKVGNQNGSGGPAKGAGSGGGTPAPSPSPQVDTRNQAPIDLQAVKHCIGNPPRQTEDPQSPPCIAYWKGDNGGATATGVTANQILLVHGSTTDTGSPTKPDDAADLLQFFNDRFETYQRKVVMKQFAPSGTATGTTGLVADANAVADMQPFAETGYADWVEGQGQVFYDQLARRHVITLEETITDEHWQGDAHFAKFAPYQWAYTLQPDEAQRATGNFICADLKGKPASHGGPSVITKTRKFGIAVVHYTDGSVNVDPSIVENQLTACGAPWKEYDFNFTDNASNTDPQVAAMQSTDGITTVLCLCDGNQEILDYMEPAGKAGYYPEWIFSQNSAISEDQSAFAAAETFDQEEGKYVLGLRYFNKAQTAADNPAVWAGRSVDPAFVPSENPEPFYHNMLLFFSGIQMAGPRLTPETFQAALFRTQFPNPGADAAPWYQARVGFDGGKHTMQDTIAPVWLSLTDPSTEAPPSSVSFCYVQHGVRLKPDDDWTKYGDLDKQLFQEPCR